MKKLISFMRNAPKRTSALLLTLAAAVIVPATLFAWGPSRTTYTIEKPADHVVFNSITNNPAHGDERNFSQVRESTASNTTYADQVSLTAGKEYVVFIYYHNNAASNLNASGKGVAKGAYVKAQIPAVVTNGSTSTKAVSYVGASNANPGEVWDDISFSNTTGGDIALRFVPGSATIHNAGSTNGKTLADSIITTGATIGYNALDGVINGCNEFSGYVTFRVKADQPNFSVSKQVHKTGVAGWKETESVNPGDSVDYLITYKNTGTTDQNNVVINDILPAGITYVEGSTNLANTTNPNGIKVSDNVTKGGINIGSYAPGATAFVKFVGKVADNDSLPTCGVNTLINTGKAQTNNGTKSDTATVTVTKTCKQPATYTCDKLNITKINKTSAQLATAYTVNNATFKSVNYVITDASGKSVTKTSTDRTLDYDFGKVGKYTIQATITATADGKDVTATSAGCTTTYEVKPDPAVYTCNKLSATMINKTSAQLATDYTVDNATFKGVTYVITDANGKSVTKTSTDRTLDYDFGKVGKYTIQATVTATADGKDVTATSAGCTTTYEVVADPPVYTCDKLDVTRLTKTSARLTTNYTVNNEATFKSVSYVISDANGKEIATKTSTDKTLDYDFGQVGKYKVQATITANANNKDVTATSAGCTSTFEIPADPVTPITPVTPTKPTELPTTGIGDSIMAIIGLGSMVASVAYYVASRRAA